MDAGDRRRIEEVAATARRWRQSTRLTGVAPRRPSIREVARIRSGRHAEDAEPLLDARRRLSQPFSAVDIEDFTDAPTKALHVGVLDLFEQVSRAVGTEMVVGFANGALTCGPVSFRHPQVPGSGPGGLTYDGNLVHDVGSLLDRISR